MNIDPNELKTRLDFAVKIAQEAGGITLKYFQQSNFDVQRKADQSPVTIADQETEKFLRQAIATAFPNDGIIGEEYENTEGTSEFRWVVDPIDGTKSFISGVPLYTTLVGVLHENESILGVICLPPLNQCLYAAAGQGAWLIRDNQPPQKTHVSDVATLDKATFVTTEIPSFAHRRAVYEELESTARLSRTWGDGFGYYLIATGQAEVMVDPVMNIWDAAAAQPVVVEAGGTFTDWQGNATIQTGESIATNGKVFDEVMKITRD